MTQGRVERFALKAEDRTYCQIAGHEIAAETCRATQGQVGCFGCASPYRRCESCNRRLVAVPSVGMCSPCLGQALSEEEKRGKPMFAPDMRVNCQLLGREIKVPVCEATQGQEGCRNCPAPSRLCETCKERPVRFSRYGLCLRCSVKEFGEGWQPTTEAETEEGEHHEVYTRSVEGDTPMKNEGERGETKEERTEKVVAFVRRARKVVRKYHRASALFLQKKLRTDYWTAREVLHRLEAAGVVGPQKGCQAREILGMEKVASRTSKRQQPSRRSTRRVHKLLGEAKRVILETQSAASTVLKERLGVGWKTAAEILHLLEEEGFVGPVEVRRRSREILAKHLHEVPRNVSTLPLTQKVRKVEELIHLLGEESELTQILRSLIVDALALKRFKAKLREFLKEE